jgi:hypothetical protein
LVLLRVLSITCGLEHPCALCARHAKRIRAVFPVVLALPDGRHPERSRCGGDMSKAKKDLSFVIESAATRKSPIALVKKLPKTQKGSLSMFRR